MQKELLVTKTIQINASLARVWDAITDPAKIKQYFFGVEVSSGWKAGTPIIFQGEFEGQSFKDKGNILDIEKERLLQYNYWSGFSGLEDKEENYSIVTYELSPTEKGTQLHLTQQGFASEEARQHADTNWDMVLKGMKEMIEEERNLKILDRKWDFNKTKADYKKVAWFYDIWSWLTESKAASKVLELAEIKDNQKILEIACGTGIVFEQIVKKNPNGQNIGMDLSPDMLEKAKRRLKKLPVQNYELREGDVFNLDFPDNSFDVVINNFMVDLMPEEDFDGIASGFYRILKPNGVVVISTFSFGKKRIHRFWYWAAQKMPALLTGCRPISFKEPLINAGFTIDNDVQISQNTFPSEVIKARK